MVENGDNKHPEMVENGEPVKEEEGSDEGLNRPHPDGVNLQLFQKKRARIDKPDAKASVDKPDAKAKVAPIDRKGKRKAADEDRHDVDLASTRELMAPVPCTQQGDPIQKKSDLVSISLNEMRSRVDSRQRTPLLVRNEEDERRGRLQELMDSVHKLDPPRGFTSANGEFVRDEDIPMDDITVGDSEDYKARCAERLAEDRRRLRDFGIHSD